MNFEYSASVSKLDRLGILLSGVCAVHCLVMPLLLPMLVLFNLGFIASESFEFWSWNITFGLCATITLYQFMFKHKHGAVFIPLALGFILMMNKELFGESVEPFVAMAVGLFLVATHFLNLKLCESCPKCQANQQQ